MKFYDTNALLNSNEYQQEDKFYISSVTLQELDNIKTNKNKTEEVRAKARSAIRWLSSHPDNVQTLIWKPESVWYIDKFRLDDTPDNRICATAHYLSERLKEPIEFVTGDLCCRTIAEKVFGLSTYSSANDSSDIYKGYQELIGDTEYINNNIDSLELLTNEYLLINNTDDGTIKELRYDGERLVPLKLPPSRYIKGKNSLQRCALDMLMNPNITVCAVLGGYGSGKSHLSTKMAIYQVQEKGNQSRIDIVREPKGEGDSVGFLRGDFSDKTDQFFLPIAQQLDGGEFELEALKQRGVLEAHIPYYCKGLTFTDSIVLVDEAEDLNEKQVRLIGTRLGENSRIFLNGDYKQSIINRNTDNALVKLCSSLKGNPMFATIYLGEDVRSETSKMFAHIFE